MELTIYDIIKGPVVSEKAYALNSKEKKVMIRVHPMANKPLVKEAFEKLFDVKVEKVNCLNRKGKRRQVKRRIVTGVLTKIAIITLKEGYDIDLFGRTGNSSNGQSLTNDASFTGVHASEHMRNK